MTRIPHTIYYDALFEAMTRSPFVESRRDLRLRVLPYSIKVIGAARR